MNTDQIRSILTIGLLAAHADGGKHERESDAIARVATQLAADPAVQLPTLVADVQAGRASLAQAAAGLQSDEARRIAFELANGVCDADGAQSPAEQAFLAALARELKLEPTAAAAVTQQAQDLAQAPLGTAGAAGASASAPAAGAAGRGAAVDNAAIDRDILEAATLNGALELLPETLSTLAIIPLQMKLVYRIGLAHGYQLDEGHVKDFLATAGVGLTSQYLEQAGRKLLGGLLGRLGGGLAGGIGRQAVSSGMSFAATYAIGQLARRYYASGRTLSTAVLQQAYSDTVREAQALYQRHLPAVQEKARQLDVGKVLAMVRGR